MSEETCKNCGEVKEDCTCKTKGETITVEHIIKKEGDNSKPESTTELKAKLAEREEQLLAIGMKKLEAEVDKFLAPIEDEQKRERAKKSIMESDDPIANFRDKKAMADLLGQAVGFGRDNNPEDISSAPPAGDAGAPPRRSAKRDEMIAFMDSQYAIMEKALASKDPSAMSTEEYQTARKKIDGMLKSFIAGRKEAIKRGDKQYSRFAYIKCPDCGELIMKFNVLEGDEITACKGCGWKQKVKRPVGV